MKTVNLHSGAVLKITPAPFADSLELTKAIAEEIKNVNMDPGREVDINLIKEMALTLVASPRVEGCVRRCMERCLYNEGRLGAESIDDTFESEKAREDYFQVFKEVLEVNVSPFMKSLYAEFLAGAKKLETLGQA